MAYETSEFTNLQRWHITFSQKVCSEQVSKNTGIYPVMFQSGFCYCSGLLEINKNDLSTRFPEVSVPPWQEVAGAPSSVDWRIRRFWERSCNLLSYFPLIFRLSTSMSLRRSKSCLQIYCSG